MFVFKVLWNSYLLVAPPSTPADIVARQRERQVTATDPAVGHPPSIFRLNLFHRKMCFQQILLCAAGAPFRARDTLRFETTDSQVDNRDIALQRICTLERMFERAISQHLSVRENLLHLKTNT